MALRLLAWFVAAVVLAATPHASAADETSLAIIDADRLRELDAGGYALQAILDAPDPPSPVFASASLQPVRDAIERAAARAWVSGAVQIVDPAALTAGTARFILAGVVNRIDRAFLTPGRCGDVRLIYRLSSAEEAPVLPMTLNVVLKTPAQDCGAFARRWRDDPVAALEALDRRAIDRIEVNVLIAHHARTEASGAHADYLLAVFRRDETSGRFQGAAMENEIDHARLMRDAGLRDEFKQWLLTPDTLLALDRGMLSIPARFLATETMTTAPPVQAPAAIITESDAVAALARAESEGAALRLIRSSKALNARLDDVTCSGCHAIRGIGGFHFPGRDWTAARHAATPAGSPQFAADQSRRGDILRAFAEGRVADLSRGFSARPQRRGEAEADDGWGVPCYRGAADPSFADWTCAPGLACHAAGPDPNFGMCFVASR